METIIVKHSDLAKLMFVCWMADIRPKVIHVDFNKEETEFCLGPGVDIKRVEWMLGLDEK